MVDERLQQFWREAQRRYNPDDTFGFEDGHVMFSDHYLHYAGITPIKGSVKGSDGLAGFCPEFRIKYFRINTIICK